MNNNLDSGNLDGPQVGKVYHVLVRGDYEWHTEKREVLDLTGDTVLYRIIPEEASIETDNSKLIKQVSLKDWRNNV